MLNQHFKAFYKLEISKQLILEHMLLNDQPEMLRQVLEDNFYTFDMNFVFDQISKRFNDLEKGLNIDEESFG
jgi:hypothetical protein